MTANPFQSRPISNRCVASAAIAAALGQSWTLTFSELGDKAARVNITLPQRILRAVDAHARKQGETRSGFLVRAALDAMRKLA